MAFAQPLPVRLILTMVACWCLLALAACQGSVVPYGAPQPQQASLPESAPETLPPARGEVIGSGPVRVAMLLPLTGAGNSATVAGELRNAARLAMADWGSSLHLVIKDTQGTANGTVDAAAEAVEERARIVLGPLFAANVTAATGVFASAGVTMIAFSTDATVAGPGVYLASYLPQTIIEQTLDHALNSGYSSFIAFLPEGPVGDVAEAQLRRSLSAAGAGLAGLARYAYDDASVAAAIESVAGSIAQADAIFIPDGGNTPGVIVSSLKRRGVDLAGKRLLGTGQWATADLANPNLSGAWLADADHDAIAAFRAKYAQDHGGTPSVLAAVAYDTVALVAGLVGRFGPEGLTSTAIEDPTGFSGFTGIFRLKSDGTNERGLTIYEVSGGEMIPIREAPRSFRALERPGM